MGQVETLKPATHPSYPYWCNSHRIRAPYLLYHSSDCASAVWLSIICVLILGWWCNGLVLPPLVVGQTSTTPSPWDPTVVCQQVCALDVDSLHPLPPTCSLLRLLHCNEDKQPSLAPRGDLLDLLALADCLDSHSHSTICRPRCLYKSSQVEQ